MRFRKLFRLYSGKEKTAYCAISKLWLLCFIQFLGSGLNWYQIWKKARYILEVSKFYIENVDLC